MGDKLRLAETKELTSRNAFVEKPRSMKLPKSAQRPRRRRRNRRRPNRPPPQSNGEKTAAIEKVIDKRLRQVDIGPAGIAFSNANLDPFGQGDNASGGYWGRGAKIPDSAMSTLSTTEYTTCQFLGTTATSAIIVAIPTVAGLVIQCVYGADATDDTKTMTATFEATSDSATVFAALAASAPASRYRVVGMGLRVTAPVSTDHSGGQLKPYVTDIVPKTAAAAYRVTGDLTGNHAGMFYTMPQGVTVRVPIMTREFQLTPATTYNSGANAGGIKFPMVVASGMSANSILRIEAVAHIEMSVNNEAVPLPIITSSFEPELEYLMKQLENAPYATTANSFKSFFQGIWKGFKSVFHFVERAVPIIGPVLKAID